MVNLHLMPHHCTESFGQRRLQKIHLLLFQGFSILFRWTSESLNMKAVVKAMILTALLQVTCATENIQEDPAEQSAQEFLKNFKLGDIDWTLYNETFVGDYPDFQVSTNEEIRQGRYYRGKDGSAAEILQPYDQAAKLEAGEVLWGPYVLKNEAGEMIESGFYFTIFNSNMKIVVDVAKRFYFHKEWLMFVTALCGEDLGFEDGVCWEKLFQIPVVCVSLWCENISCQKPSNLWDVMLWWKSSWCVEKQNCETCFCVAIWPKEGLQWKFCEQFYNSKKHNCSPLDSCEFPQVSVHSKMQFCWPESEICFPDSTK